MRHFVIGDVRGNLSMMKRMIDKLGITPDDWILFTGSMIGPGPDSKGVIDHCISLRQKFPGNFHFLVGCYEATLKRIIAENNTYSDRLLWKNLQGVKVLESYASGIGQLPAKSKARMRLQFQISKPHLDFMEYDMQLWYRHNDLGFVVYHAGPDPTQKFGEAPNAQIVTMGLNNWWLQDLSRFGHRIIFSHIVFPQPFIRPNIVGIDLGCGLTPDGKLCAYNVEADSFTIMERYVN